MKPKKPEKPKKRSQPGRKPSAARKPRTEIRRATAAGRDLKPPMMVKSWFRFIVLGFLFVAELTSVDFMSVNRRGFCLADILPRCIANCCASLRHFCAFFRFDSEALLN